ncbi:hypothetical protein EA187_16020 [Lujinxingia sediminis]|uniref:Lipoprotein n=1 Tax=Lujinxingia sediminis TaxID=2480984 RepID=A0ABY0CPI8_9DELT|nr:hypothetical protein [Lujinxingia sediminis]RVU42383.1 hypothetical protein EA187_16020 [Lujinxingia sediminis]
MSKNLPLILLLMLALSACSPSSQRRGVPTGHDGSIDLGDAGDDSDTDDAPSDQTDAGSPDDPDTDENPGDQTDAGTPDDPDTDEGVDVSALFATLAQIEADKALAFNAYHRHDCVCNPHLYEPPFDTFEECIDESVLPDSANDRASLTACFNDILINGMYDFEGDLEAYVACEAANYQSFVTCNDPIAFGTCSDAVNADLEDCYGAYEEGLEDCSLDFDPSWVDDFYVEGYNSCI